jgi:hypothetical protein
MSDISERKKNEELGWLSILIGTDNGAMGGALQERET